MTQRAYEAGVFDSLGSDTKKLRLASLGGGPGFEMYAMQEFLKKHLPHIVVETTSQDLGQDWEHFANILHCNFISGNFYDSDLIERIGNEYDYVVLSYVVYHYLRNKPSILINLITKYKLRGVFVNERFQNLEVFDYLEDNGIKVIRLINQHLGRDDRQLFLTKRNQCFISHKNRPPFTFPNVPYEEHKNRKRRRSKMSSSSNRPRKFVRSHNTFV